MKDYEESWESFWKEICTKEDGSLNIDQIKRELFDYSYLMKQAARVYSEVAGLSKTNYDATTIIKEYENKLNERFKDYAYEIINDLQETYQLHVASEQKEDNWYADGIKDSIEAIQKYCE